MPQQVRAPSRKRLDQLLVERGLAPSRERAKALALAGQVRLDGQPAAKPGVLVGIESRLEVLSDPCPYVSRGGLKLESAWKAFGFDSRGRICLDVGASTGGFTDFLLQRGAARVYAVDVGYGQLAWKLRTDPRVVVLERTHARELTAARVPEPIDLAVVDVAFISLEKVMPAVAALLGPRAQAVCLVKPQFEAGPEKVGKRGVVRDPAIHAEVLARVASRVPEWGLVLVGAAPSGLRGPEGNVEFFFHLAREGRQLALDAPELAATAAREV